jgi:hypothetical protein
MGKVAVITGDIVASRKITNRTLFAKALKSIFAMINREVLQQKGSFEIFRGDSFQVIVKDAEKALLVAILIRAGLNMGGQEGSMFAEPVDVRMAIGIGTISYKAKKIIESDGEAFHRSGAGLEILNQSDEKLYINTPWEEVNQELIVSTLLADALIRKWTSAAAQAFFYALLRNATQQELAEFLGISQPAVHKRLLQSNLAEIKFFINRFNSIIFQYRQ